MVIRTGFSTSKGKLVQSILFPKPNKFKFYEDSFKYIFVLFLISLIGFGICIPAFINQGISTETMIDRSLDLITITVPPGLPVAMTIGTAFAISRLKKQQIFCISPPRVNVAGKISIFVFDKTGTLTDEGMNIYGIKCLREHAKFEKGLQEPLVLNEELLKSVSLKQTFL